MLRQFKETPAIETGYLLEPDRGWFSVVEPVAKQNLIVNPSFVNYPTFNDNIGNVNATLTATTDGVHSPTGISVAQSNPNLSRRTIRYVHNDRQEGLHTFSVYIKNPTGGEVSLVVGGTEPLNSIRYKNVNITADWERYYITTEVPASANTSITLSVTSTATDFQITDMQYEEESLTTFFTGDTVPDLYDGPNAYVWTGLPYRSTSARSNKAFSGGEQVSLYSLGFKVTSIEGLGYPALSPILHEQSYTDDRLFDCSTIEPRDISINGIITACDFESLSCIRGRLGKLLYQSKRPTRIYFTPYDFCKENVPCIYFDFLYTDGLNEEIESWFGQEISIEGTTLSPCINSCDPYSYSAVELEDLFVDYEDDYDKGMFFIDNDNQFVKANVPQFTTTGGDLIRNQIIDSVEANGILYAIIVQGTVTTSEYHFVRYINNVWEVLMTTSKVAMAGANKLSTFNGLMLTLEYVPGINYGGIYVGGYFEKSTVTIPSGITLHQFWGDANTASLGRFDPTDDSITLEGVFDSTYADGPGSVTALEFNTELNMLFVGGSFDSVNLADGTIIPSTNFRGLYYISFAKDGEIYQGPQELDYDDVTEDDGGESYFVNDALVINSIWSEGNDLYVLGNMYQTPYSVNANSQAFIYRYEIIQTSLNTFDIDYVEVSHPYAYGVGEGAMTQMLKYGNNFFVSGYFDQATSDYNSVSDTYNNGNGYMYNIGWYDPLGYNDVKNIFSGRYLPIGATLSSLNYQHGIGLFYEDNLQDPRPILNTPIGVHIERLNGNIIFFGEYSGYEFNDDKNSTCSIVEFLPLSSENLSHGVFIPPTLDYEFDGVVKCRPYIKTFDNIYGINAFVGDSEGLFLPSQRVYYNSGIIIDSCDSHYVKKASMIIDTDGGVLGIAGIKNMTTESAIYFEPVDLPTNKIVTVTIEDQVVVFRGNDNTESRPANVVNSGDPFLVNNGDVVQLIFEMSNTHAAKKISGENVNNPTFTLKTLDCYLSFDEVMICEECT